MTGLLTLHTVPPVVSSGTGFTECLTASYSFSGPCRYKYNVQPCHSSHQPLWWRQRQSLKCWILTPSLCGCLTKKTSSHVVAMIAWNHMLYRMMQPYENVYVWLLGSWLEPRCWMWPSLSHSNTLWIIWTRHYRLHPVEKLIWIWRLHLTLLRLLQ
jgi:hypothetical protein